MYNKTDYSGEIINGFKLNKRIEDYILPSGKAIARYDCTCIFCKRNTQKTYHDIKYRKTEECTCDWKKKPRPYQVKDITNQRFGKCVAKERLSNGKWKCLCDCGNWFTTNLYRLTSGHTKSCGCLKHERNHRFEDLTGKIFGELIVEKYLYSKKIEKGGGATMWLCKCSCGNETIAGASSLKSGHIISCGCKKSSYRETLIKKWLDDHNIKNRKEYKFEDLKYKQKLRFDFAIFSNKTLLGLIEHQGIQHYENTKWGKTEREITDKMKKEYCKLHNIPLYEIKYNSNIDEELTNIITELYANTVPSLQETA